MAQNPQEHAETYGLSQNVAADFEEEEGPALGAHTGQTRTRIPEHADRQGHGPKSQQHAREVARGERPGGTH
jgi:hypothetical protein